MLIFQQITVIAQDEDGGINSLRNTESVNITLTDINDNAPFLDMSYPVIWYENQEPGDITELKARDYDSDENGAPFAYQIDSSADNTILTRFEISGNKLIAKIIFDREERKSYEIPVAITDSGRPTPLTGVSKLVVIIGDKNDNLMEDGSSSIFVYDYKGETPDVDIGYVYVQDLDDWDRNDKTFSWFNDQPMEGFDLDRNTGMIKLLHSFKNKNKFNNKFNLKNNTRNNLKKDSRSGTHELKFTVTEES